MRSVRVCSLLGGALWTWNVITAVNGRIEASRVVALGWRR